MVNIRLAGPDDVEACVRVLAELPDYFTPDTHDVLASQMQDGRTWVAETDDGVCGFLHVVRRYPASAEITFAAVRPSWRRRGVGGALLATALPELRTDGVTVVE